MGEFFLSMNVTAEHIERQFIGRVLGGGGVIEAENTARPGAWIFPNVDGRIGYRSHSQRHATNRSNRDYFLYLHICSFSIIPFPADTLPAFIGGIPT